MKKIIYLIAVLLSSFVAFTQAPQQISYQAVVRNNNNVLVAGSPVSVSISIVKDSSNGTVVYSELHSAYTNANGLFSIAIGTGLYASGSLSAINWASGLYFIKSQIDPTGGLNFTITGASQILSVPYALYAANGTQPGNNVGDMQYWNGTQWVILPAGANGSTLTMCNGVPSWSGCTVVVAPTVTTSTPSSITNTTVVCGGDVTSNGGASVTSYGICYATTSNPTTSNSTIIVGSGTGSYSTTISGLSASTTYYLRAYATNSVGTSYGNQVIITTANQTLNAPTVQTLSATAPSNGTAGTAVGVISSNGGASITTQGVCWSANPNPTVADSSASGYYTSSTDTFYTNYSNMAAGTTYYVRAYATNSVGTSYGNQITVTTPSAVKYTIGESYGGGTIFYIDGSGQHGLIAANNDAGGMMPWDKSTSGTFATTGATDTTVGGGAANTTTIISTLGSGSYAAYIASQTANGYSDWYLPSKGELELMFNNLWTKSLGNFTGNVYWTSSEYNANQAWAQEFNENTYTNNYTYWKSNSAYVRPIRKF